jgi:hypothetical protein
MIWNVSVGVRLSIDYDVIKADSEEEAKQIARIRALEDVDFNNASLDEYGGLTVYCAWPEEESEAFECED